MLWPWPGRLGSTRGLPVMAVLGLCLSDCRDRANCRDKLDERVSDAAEAFAAGVWGAFAGDARGMRRVHKVDSLRNVHDVVTATSINANAAR